MRVVYRVEALRTNMALVDELVLDADSSPGLVPGMVLEIYGYSGAASPLCAWLDRLIDMYACRAYIMRVSLRNVIAVAKHRETLILEVVANDICSERAVS